MRRYKIPNRPKEIQLDSHAVIAPTVDGDYMLFVNGFQTGGVVDRSGAGDATFPTVAEARAFYKAWKPKFWEY